MNNVQQPDSHSLKITLDKGKTVLNTAVGKLKILADSKPLRKSVITQQNEAKWKLKI